MVLEDAAGRLVGLVDHVIVIGAAARRARSIQLRLPLMLVPGLNAAEDAGPVVFGRAVAGRVVLRPVGGAYRMEPCLGANAPCGPWSADRVESTVQPMRSERTPRYALAATLVGAGIACIELSAGAGWTMILLGAWFAVHTSQLGSAILLNLPSDATKLGHEARGIAEDVVDEVDTSTAEAARATAAEGPGLAATAGFDAHRRIRCPPANPPRRRPRGRAPRSPSGERSSSWQKRRPPI